MDISKRIQKVTQRNERNIDHQYSVNILMDEINRQSRLSDDGTHEMVELPYRKIRN